MCFILRRKGGQGVIDVRTGAFVYVVIGVMVVRIVLRNDDVKFVTTGARA